MTNLQYHHWLLPFMLTTLVAICLSATTNRNVGATGKHVFCYYVGDGQYRQYPGKFLPRDLDPNLCTHVIFAFVNVKNNSFRPADWNHQGPRGLYQRTLALKNRNPRLKVLLAVGGWVANYRPFREAIATNASMAEFASNCVKFLRDNSLDGLDMDWEFPGSRGSPSEDKFKFTTFLQTIQGHFQDEARRSGKEKLILTLACPVGIGFIYAGYEANLVHRHVDYMLLMTYNFHGGWSNETGHHSPLLANSLDNGQDKQLCQAWAVNFWLYHGVPKEKAILGIATYGMTFTLADSKVNGIKAPAMGNGRPGRVSKQSGIQAYYEICDLLRDPEAKSEWLKDEQAPYVALNDQWVGYDDPKSVKIKVRKLIHGLDLAGAFIWSVDLDDFGGHCGSGKFPLLRAINEELNNPRIENIPELSQCSQLGHGMHADVTSCHNYIICLQDQNGGYQQSTYQCPPGLSYDERWNYCMTRFDCL